jgi:hypothetical protein
MKISPWSEKTVSEYASTAWREVLGSLWSLNSNHGIDGIPTPLIVSLNDAAKKAWTAFEAAYQSEISSVDFPTHLRGPWAKLEAYCARLALVIHEIRFGCGETSSPNVEEISVRAAWRLVDYFKSHTQRVYAHLRSDPIDRGMRIAFNWIEKRGGTCKPGDLIAYGVAGIKNAQQAEHVLNQLRERGLGEFEQHKPNKGPEGRKFVLVRR